MFIPNILKQKVSEWRITNYACEYPTISEILGHNLALSSNNTKVPRFLRSAQFEALETYWYLRIVEKTPHILELYEKLITEPSELLKSLGINISQDDLTKILLSGGGMNAIFEKIRMDDNFVRKYKLEAVRETLTLEYPSYILALAMGSGKTILIGAIIASEFSLSIEYPEENFVKNALVFAPGKTILGALKEISDIPFDQILPPRLYKQFLSSVKITYTQDGQKNIPIIQNSIFNIIITNTEKIRIQKPTSNGIQLSLLKFKDIEKKQEQEETANLRLQIIASLPNLAIFSDEAHHTYGQSLDTELKKVRKTVDYLAQNTNVVCVINTTGTPYYKRQLLKDVVYWYGLSQGIKDGILKEVRDSIITFQDVKSDKFVELVLEDFFTNYNNVRIYNGAQAKIAIYFPQLDDLRQSKPIVEKTLLKLKINPSTVLEVHNQSDEQTKDYFDNRINEINNPYRVYLLVNKGTEGWNCLSLFATALARKLTSSNNFVLQAATRCLRQTPSNNVKARIYLSKENVVVLDNQLQETFGESLTTLNTVRQDLAKTKLILQKIEIPSFSIKKKIRRIVDDEHFFREINLVLPTITKKQATKITLDWKERPEIKNIMKEVKSEKVEVSEEYFDVFEMATEISTQYRLSTLDIVNKLSKIYPENSIPHDHILPLKGQIEKQLQKWKIEEEEIEESLALVKIDGFQKESVDGKIAYTAEIAYHKEREHLFLNTKQIKNNKNNYGFHYTPYNFDSAPEKDFFIKILDELGEKPDDVEDIYFTGGITDISKTDFLFEYKDIDGEWRTYTPDFLIKKKNGKILIVEIKSERLKDDTIDGKNGLKAMAIRKIEDLNPDKVKYEILLTGNEKIGFENVSIIKQWIYGTT